MAEKHYALIGPIRFAFTNLDTPKAIKGPGGQPKGDPHYSVKIFGPQASYDNFTAAAFAAAAETWPGSDVTTLFQTGAALWPLKDGNAEVAAEAQRSRDGSHFAGNVVMTCRTDFVVDVRNPSKQQVAPGQKDTVAYNGAWGYIHGEVRAYNGVGGGRPGVKLYLMNVMVTGDGDRLGGGMSAEEAFAGITGRPTAANPAATLPEMANPAPLPESPPAPAVAPMPAVAPAPVPAAPAPVASPAVPTAPAATPQVPGVPPVATPGVPWA